MKKKNPILLLFLIVIVMVPLSCYNEVPEEFVGTWESALTLVEVPVANDEGSEDIYTDSIVFGLQISSGKMASGYIGMANFTDAPVKKNPGDAENKGIAFIIKCGEMGKLFPGDPLEAKKIEINLKPIHGATMGSEINIRTKNVEWFPFMIADPEYYRVD